MEKNDINTEVKKEEASTQKEEIVDTEKRDLEVSSIIKNHMMVSMGFGAIPIPLVDIVGLTGTQLNMLRKLSAIYGHAFSEELANKAIASLLKKLKINLMKNLKMVKMKLLI